MIGFVIFLCAVTLVTIVIGLILRILVKKKKGAKFALGWFIAWFILILLFDAMMLLFWLTGNDLKYLWYALVLALITSILLYFPTKNIGSNAVDHILAIGMMPLIIIAALFVCGLFLCFDNAPQHTIYKEYEIIIEDNSVTITCDLDEISNEAGDLIQNQINQMRESNQTHYNGRLAIRYKCHYPPLRNNHDKCICTEDRMCEICKEYAVGLAITEE